MKNDICRKYYQIPVTAYENRAVRRSSLCVLQSLMRQSPQENKMRQNFSLQRGQCYKQCGLRGTNWRKSRERDMGQDQGQTAEDEQPAPAPQQQK